LTDAAGAVKGEQREPLMQVKSLLADDVALTVSEG
jgi:hypothetical protein